MTPMDRMRKSLQDSDPTLGLRTVVMTLYAEGCDEAELQGQLESLLVDNRRRTDFREADEDAILDVLDSLTGWCHEDAKLLP